MMGLTTADKRTKYVLSLRCGAYKHSAGNLRCIEHAKSLHCNRIIAVRYLSSSCPS